MLRILVLLALSLTISAINRITEHKTWGPQIVESCVRKIQTSCIFPNDHGFLRRVAFQESQDGRSLVRWSDEKGKAGIWQVDQQSLKDLQTTSSVLLQQVKQEVKSTFNVSIDSLNWANGDLEVPLHSSIAASGKILEIPKPVPLTLDKQAEYWKNYYTSNKHAQPSAFISNIANLPNCSSRGVDLVFVIDSSGSIGEEIFPHVRSFIKRVVRGIDIGENATRIGIIDYSDTVEIVLSLSSSTEEILAAADSMPYLSESTETGKALEAAALDIDENARNASDGYPRVAVLITDGVPDNVNAADLAATRLKQAGVTLFTVAVTDAVTNIENLENMASTPNCMHFYKLTDYMELASDFPEVIVRRTCQLTTTVASNVNQISASISGDESLYLKLPVNATTGTTLKLSAEEGISSLYVSLSEDQPSAAIYDYTAAAFAGAVVAQVYLSPKALDAASVSGEDGDSQPYVYASVSGIFDTNTFTLHLDDGDTTVDKQNSAISSMCTSRWSSVLVSSLLFLFARCY